MPFAVCAGNNFLQESTAARSCTVRTSVVYWASDKKQSGRVNVKTNVAGPSRPGSDPALGTKPVCTSASARSRRAFPAFPRTSRGNHQQNDPVAGEPRDVQKEQRSRRVPG